MKKTLMLMFFLLIFAGMFAVDVVIGTGTAYNTYYGYPAVYGGWYMNAHEQYLVTAGELAGNGGGAGNITSIAFNVNAVNGCGPLPNFTIRLGHTTDSVLNTTFYTGVTQVYTLANYQPLVGVNTHVFDTPFSWNGTENLVVDVTFDMQTAYTENTSTYYTSTASYQALYYCSDSVAWNTVTTGTLSNNRPNMIFNMPAGGAIAPFPAILVSPGNGAAYVSTDATLNWASGGGGPNGYDLYFGVAAAPPFMADLGNVNTYDPMLEPGTTYYWQIVPYNAEGDATGCPVWSFTTAPAGLVGIGSGTDVSPLLPIYAFYGYTYSQSIYLASELGAPGLITSISYYWNGAAANAASNAWTVYMGHTPNAVFSSATDWLPLGSLTQVFSGTVDAPATPGWVNIPLTTPFLYDGSNNLVVGVDENAAGYDSPYGYFYCTGVAGVRSLLYYSDGTNPDPAVPPAAMYQRAAFPNVLIQKTDLAPAPPAAPILTYPGDAATGIPLSGWNLTWNMNPAGGLPDYYGVYMSQSEANLYSDLYYETTNTFADPVANLGATLGNSQTWYWTVEAFNTLGSAVTDPYWRFTTIAPPPQIAVNPTSFTQALEHGQTATQQMTITNNGGLPLNYNIGFTDTTVRGTGITPYDPTQVIPTEPINAAATEHSPIIGPYVEADARTIFDVQFVYPTSFNDGEYGVATDGNYFYISNWGYAGNGIFNKYALDGTFVSTMTIPGVPGIRDLAYDGTYFYGGAASTTIYIMDFTAGTLVGTVPAPVAVRGIAYDPDLDALWVGNQWAADIRCIDRATGTQISSLVPAIASFAGIAYDNLSGPTPTIWGNTENGTTGNLVAQIDLATGNVLQSFDVTDTQIPGLTASGASCGGIEIFPNLVPGTASIICNTQNFAFYGLELCTTSSWVAADPRTGTVAPGGSAIVDIDFDATETPAGIYTGTFSIANNAGPNVNVPVQMTVTGDWPAVFSIDNTTWNYGDVEHMNPAVKQFTITNTGGDTPTPLIIGAGGITITGDAEGNFTVDAPGLPVSLGHNDTYSFDVTFTPQTVGAKTATLNITDNLATRVLHTVALSGNSIPEDMGEVVNLQATLQGLDTVQLTWILYNGTPGMPGWIHYDDGTNYDGIGTSGAAVFDVAAKFPSSVMWGYNGMQLTKINYFPRSANTTYTLKVWTGNDATMAPETMVYSQPHVPTVMAWNEVTLTTPVPINGAAALYIGYESNVAVVDAATDDYYPAGCDAGPANTGLGDLISLGTWESMNASYSLNYNWNLQGYVAAAPIRNQAPLLSIPVINNRANLDRSLRFASASGNTSSRVLRGYNVYRDAALLTPTLIPNTAYTDLSVPLGVHNYTVEGVYYSANTAMSNTATIEVTAAVPYALPFAEAWDSNDFLTNQWEATAANWMTTTGTGDPVPSVMFSWSPAITNYETYLTGWPLAGTGHSNVWISFELSLNNYSTAAENWFGLEVWNGSVWTNVHTWSSFENAGDGWGFEYFAFDISAWAAGHDFKVRFKASGENSFEINYWCLDNINVYEMPATLAAPVTSVSLAAPDVYLDWTSVPGATWYGVYAANDPYGIYTYLGWSPASYNGAYLMANPMQFYKVTAGAGPLPLIPPIRGTRFNSPDVEVIINK